MTLYPGKGGRGKVIDYSVYTHKLCSKCRTVKPVTEFKRERRASGIGWRYKSQCKECQRPYHRQYAARSRRTAGVPQRTRMSQEEMVASHKRSSRKHYRKHAPQERARTKIWRRANPEKQRFMEKRRRARLQNAPGSHTFEQWQRLLFEHGHMCPYCQRHEPEIQLTQDHIIPLSRGGSDDISNIQPLCVSCNASKGAKDDRRLETDLFRLAGVEWVEPERREFDAYMKGGAR